MIFEGTIDYIKNSLETIKNVLISTKETLSIIANIFKIISEILGFIGIRVFILIALTNFVNSLIGNFSQNKKTNYVISVILIFFFSVSIKIPHNILLKYLIFMSSPLIIGFTIKIFVKYYNILYKIVAIKFNYYFNRVTFFKKDIKDNDKITIIFTTDINTNEYKKLEENKNILILEKEKIFLTENEISFSDTFKKNQFLKSLKYENNFIWCWNDDYKINKYLDFLEKEKKINQKNYIIGSKNNSYILNFLQNNWNYTIIYGLNYKEYLNSNITNINIIKNNYNLTLINNYDLKTDFSLKSKIIGSDLSILINEIGTKNELKFNNSILFLDINETNNNVLYKMFNQLQNYILNKNIKIKSVVFGNINNIQNIIDDFTEKINIPIFKINNFDFIKLNTQCLIDYKNNKINMLTN